MAAVLMNCGYILDSGFHNEKFDIKYIPQVILDVLRKCTSKQQFNIPHGNFPGTTLVNQSMPSYF